MRDLDTAFEGGVISSHFLTRWLATTWFSLVIRSSWCVRKSPGRPSPRVSPGMTCLFNLCPAPNLSALGLLYLWKEDSGADGCWDSVAPPAPQKQEVTQRSLRGLVTQPQGQEEDRLPEVLVKNWSH